MSPVCALLTALLRGPITLPELLRRVGERTLGDPTGEIERLLASGVIATSKRPTDGAKLYSLRGQGEAS